MNLLDEIKKIYADNSQIHLQKKATPILDKIRDAAKNGEKSINIHYPDVEVIEYLRKESFIIKGPTYDPRDDRDSGWYTISGW